MEGDQVGLKEGDHSNNCIQCNCKHVGDGAKEGRTDEP